MKEIKEGIVFSKDIKNNELDIFFLDCTMVNKTNEKIIIKDMRNGNQKVINYSDTNDLLKLLD